jgi:hypothetical protein
MVCTMKPSAVLPACLVTLAGALACGTGDSTSGGGRDGGLSDDGSAPPGSGLDNGSSGSGSGGLDNGSSGMPTGSGSSNSGCGSGGASASSSSSSGVMSGSTSGASSGTSSGVVAGFDGSALCVPLPLSLSAVPAVDVTTAGTSLSAMSGPGGPILNGYYYLTSETVYAGGTPDPATRGVWNFDCSGIARETDDSPSATAWIWAFVDDSTSGWVISFTSLCDGHTMKIPYSGGASGFTLYDYAHGRVETFTKQ